MNLESLIEKDSDSAAIFYGDKTYSYQDIREKSIKRAKTWKKNSLSSGQRIGIIHDNPLDIIISIFACAQLKLVFSILPPAEAIFSREQLLQDLQPHFITRGENLGEHSSSAPLCSSDVQAIFYTSGSTSNPRGVQHSAKSLLICAKEMAERLRFSKSDRALLILPLSFHYGFSFLSSLFWSGGSLVLSETRFPIQLLRELEKFQCNILGLVPHFGALFSKTIPTNGLITLKKLIFAGDSCPPQLLHSLRSQLPTVELHLFYGCTETLRACHHHWKTGDPSNILGKPLPSVSLNQTKHGTLMQEGPTLMLGYWNASAPCPSYPLSHDIGDIVTQDLRGNWIFISRSVDIIKSRGYRISPLQIEKILLEAPNILEAIVFQKNGNIEAAIAMSTIMGISSELDEIPYWLRPKKVHYFAQQLPRSPRGKISRQWIIQNVLYPRPSSLQDYLSSSSKKSED